MKGRFVNKKPRARRKKICPVRLRDFVGGAAGAQGLLFCNEGEKRRKNTPGQLDFSRESAKVILLYSKKLIFR